jgi:hypothetical protein
MGIFVSLSQDFTIRPVHMNLFGTALEAPSA